MYLRIYKEVLACQINGTLLKLYHNTNQIIGNRIVSGENTETLQSRYMKYLEDISRSNNPPMYPNELFIQRTCETRRDSRIINFRDDNLPNKQFDDNDVESNRNESHMIARNLLSIWTDLERSEYIGNKDEVRKLLRSIDKRCYHLVDALLPHEMLNLLNKLTRAIPHRITQTKFYSASLEKLLKTSSLSSNHQNLINWLYLTSFRKLAGRRDITLALAHLTDIKELKLIEKCIVATSSFKSGVKLHREIIRTIEATIVNEIETLLQDPALMVSLTKAVRISGPSPEFSLNKITKIILTNTERYPISTAAPLLALCAETRLVDASLIERLVADSVTDIVNNGTKVMDIKSYSIPAVRLKDVDRLLWAITMLDHKLSKSQFIEIENFIWARFSEYRIEPQILVGTLLSLWMLGNKNYRIIQESFRKNVFQSLLRDRHPANHRLRLLLSCITIEAPRIQIPHDHVVQRNFGYKPPKRIELVASSIKCLADHLALSNIRIEYPIDGIKTPGISAEHKNLGRIHVDILKKASHKKEINEANRYLNLKIRLVQALGYKSILLRDVMEPDLMFISMEDAINLLLNK